jgi:hypothetical protein
MHKNNIKKRFVVQEGTPYNQKIGRFDLTGQTYGILKVLGFEKRDDNGTALWRIQCNVCGSIRVVNHGTLTKSPQRCGCRRLLGTPRMITVGAGLLPLTSKNNPIKTTPAVSFEFHVDSVKKAVVDLRKERSEYYNATYKYRTQGITANRDMHAWRQDMDVREDNITFRLLDMIKELQTKVEGLENELKQK